MVDVNKVVKEDLKSSLSSDLWLKKLHNTVKEAKKEYGHFYEEVVKEMERLSDEQTIRVLEASNRYNYLFDKVKRMNNGERKTSLKNEIINLQKIINDQPFINEVIISYPEIFKSAYGLV